MGVDRIKASEISKADFELYLEWVAEYIKLIEPNGAFWEDYGAMEAELKYFFRDDNSYLYKYVDDGDILAFLSVRELPDKTIFIDMGLSGGSRIQYIDRIMQAVCEQYPEWVVYTLVHNLDISYMTWLEARPHEKRLPMYHMEHPHRTYIGKWSSVTCIF